jgi:hypothetical protein
MSESRLCKQCKEIKPETAFLKLKGRGIKVVYCNQCAQANMRKWARTKLSSFDPDKARKAAVED